MREKLIAQDRLSTLIKLDPAGQSAEIVGSMIDYLPVEEGNASLIAKMAEPEIRIVSLSVTEGCRPCRRVWRALLDDVTTEKGAGLGCLWRVKERLCRPAFVDLAVQEEQHLLGEATRLSQIVGR